MDSHPIKSNKSVLDSIEYKRALEAMDKIMADEQTVSVPIDEDGRDARTEIYSMKVYLDTNMRILGKACLL